MDKSVKIFKDGKLICEIPLEMFPLQISAPLTDNNKVWSVRSYTWKLSYHKDENWKNRFDLPKGTQLQ